LKGNSPAVTAATQLHVVLNWTEELKKRRVPRK
jgi:hypothetical protein